MLVYRRACHGAVPQNGAISSTTTQLLWLLYTQAESEQSHSGMHSSYLRHLWECQKGSRHTSAWNKISAAFYTFGKLSLSTQLDVCFIAL